MIYVNTSLSRVPLFRVAIIFIIGVCIARYNNFYLQWNIWLVISTITLAIALNIHYTTKSLYGFFIHISFFVLGIWVYQIHRTTPDLTLNATKDFIIQIDNVFAEKKNSYQTVAIIKSKRINDTWNPVFDTKATLYFSKDSSVNRLKPGDILVIHSNMKLNTIDSEFEFYKRFLEQQNIYYWSYIAVNKWKYVECNSTIQYYFLAVRNKILSYYKNKGLDTGDFALLAAIVFGDKQYLDKQTKLNFSQSGALHLLAVSGFHVALLASILYAMCFILGKSTIANMFRLFLLLIAVWSFSFITGMSPSVQRAAIMISIFAIAKGFSFNTNVYNTLAGSALITLCLTPDDLFNAGFQLSYAAVLGIVYFFTKIKKQCTVNNFIIQYIIDATIIAIAAQIGTIGFVLMYFNMYPTYGLAANLFVVLESIAITILALAMPICGLIHSKVELFIGYLLHVSATSLDKTTALFGSFPHAMCHINFSVFDTVFLYTLMLGGIAIYEIRKQRLAFAY